MLLISIFQQHMVEIVEVHTRHAKGGSFFTIKIVITVHIPNTQLLASYFKSGVPLALLLLPDLTHMCSGEFAHMPLPYWSSQ